MMSLLSGSRLHRAHNAFDSDLDQVWVPSQVGGTIRYVGEHVEFFF